MKSVYSSVSQGSWVCHILLVLSIHSKCVYLNFLPLKKLPCVPQSFQLYQTNGSPISVRDAIKSDTCRPISIASYIYARNTLLTVP